MNIYRHKLLGWLASRQPGAIDLTLAGLVALAGVCSLMLLGVL